MINLILTALLLFPLMSPAGNLTLPDYDTLLSLDDQQRPDILQQQQQQQQRHESQSGTENVASLPTYVFKAPRPKQGTSMPGGHSGGQTGSEWNNGDMRSVAAESNSVSEAPTPGGSDDATEGACCAVCLETYSEGQTLMILPCIHQFHEECISQHLRQRGLRATCPVCKTPCFL